MEKSIPKKVAFCEETVIESCKRKAKAVKTEKAISRICMQYCQLLGKNPTHSTTDCFELNCKKNRAFEFIDMERLKKAKKPAYPVKGIQRVC